MRLSNGQLLSISGPDGVFYYFVDAWYNVIGIIDSSGTADWYTYQPFGETVDEPASPKYNPYRYEASYLDNVNGKELYYMHFRYYDPEYGRFTQLDPINHLSDFIYAGNNPILNSDPLGLLCFGRSCHPFMGAVGALARGASNLATSSVNAVKNAPGAAINKVTGAATNAYVFTRKWIAGSDGPKQAPVPGTRIGMCSSYQTLDWLDTFCD